MREYPTRSLVLERFSGGSASVSDYFVAQRAHVKLMESPNDPVANAATLAAYIFDHHPMKLDLAAAMTHRYGRASDYMGRYLDGQELLEEHILHHFQTVHQCLTEGFVSVDRTSVPPPIIFRAAKRPLDSRGEHPARRSKAYARMERMGARNDYYR